MLSHFLSFLSLVSIGIIFALSLLRLVNEGFQFWPPPSKKSWQHRTFMLLFRGFLYPLIILTVLKFDLLNGTRALLQYAVGTVLLVTGFGLAFWITHRMGWRNAFGEKRGLQTLGFFSQSRNPIYVATWLGLLGWALIANNILISIHLMLWALLYVFAPFFEEPWLENEYGDEYLAYKARTPRFL